jgi:hypothetical protein
MDHTLLCFFSSTHKCIANLCSSRVTRNVIQTPELYITRDVFQKNSVQFTQIARTSTETILYVGDLILWGEDRESPCLARRFQ